MLTKEDCMKMLYADKRFTSILSLTKNESEKKMIESTVQQLVESMTNALAPIVTEYNKNPSEFKKKLVEDVDPSLITKDTNKK